jgi:cell wall-associated NlpC family hydrolase
MARAPEPRPSAAPRTPTPQPGKSPAPAKKAPAKKAAPAPFVGPRIPDSRTVGPYRGSTDTAEPVLNAHGTVRPTGGSFSLRGVLDLGMSFLGQPYVWGGSNPATGFDCSGLLQYIYGKNGVQIPRVAHDQAGAGTAVAPKDAQPGDLIAFDNSRDRPGADHIGIYLGNGKMLQAPRTGRNIEVVNVNLAKAMTIRRVAPQTATTYTGLGKAANGQLVYDAKVPATAVNARPTPPTSISANNGGGDQSSNPTAVGIVGTKGGLNANLGTGAVAKPKTPAEIRAYAETNYGYLAVYLDDREIGPILLKAAAEGWDAHKIEGALVKTKFWKTHSEANRSWDYLNTHDNATAKAKVQATISEITTAAQRDGITLTGLQIHDLAVTANRNGWNPQQTLAAMKAHGKLDPTKVKSDYGKYTALAATNPEIKGLLDQATKSNWSPQQFEQAVQGSKWYTTTTPAQRDLQLAQATDPAGATEARSKAHDKVNQAATNLGVPLTPAVIALADQAFENGWTDDEINRKLADLVQVNPQGANTGQTAVTLAALRSQARSYLVPISDATLSSWVTQIQRGDVPPASFEAYLKEQAKSLFPGMKGAIDAGVTPEQYVNPYRELAAQTLELNPQDIDFLDPKWSGALFQQGQDGTRTSMSLADWQNSLRRRPEYTKTRGAQTQAAALTESITKMFGKVSA